MKRILGWHTRVNESEAPYYPILDNTEEIMIELQTGSKKACPPLLSWQDSGAYIDAAGILAGQRLVRNRIFIFIPLPVIIHRPKVDHVLHLLCKPGKRNRPAQLRVQSQHCIPCRVPRSSNSSAKSCSTIFHPLSPAALPMSPTSPKVQKSLFFPAGVPPFPPSYP